MFKLSKLSGHLVIRFNIQKFYILSPYYNYVFFRISDQRAIIVLYSMN
jgi:hypothetical protein